MSSNSNIEWCDATWNCIRGCSRVSDGCKNCYAEAVAWRFKGPGKPYEGLVKKVNGRPTWNGKIKLLPEKLTEPLHWRKPRRIFVNSMSDLWHDGVPVEFILAVWAVMEATPQHTYQILTKRPKRMLDLLGSAIPNGHPHQLQPAYDRKPIPGWPGYYADTEGTIWSSRRRGLKKLSPGVITKWGHSHVCLCGGPGVTKREKVHRLVLTTFEREPKPGEECCHIDGNPANNQISNLRWGSRAENSSDRTRHGNANTAPVLTVKQAAEVRIASLCGWSHRSIARIYNISHTQVGRIASGNSRNFKILPNVHLGVSVEDQATADERIPLLLDTPAAVRWVSAEPLLGAVDFTCIPWSPNQSKQRPDDDVSDGVHSLRCLRRRTNEYCGLSWIVTGGESGPDARPCDVSWIRSIIQQCKEARTPCFVKQLGAKPAGWCQGINFDPDPSNKYHSDFCDVWESSEGRDCGDRCIYLKSKKCSDMNEWPEDLRVREYPA